MAWDYLDIFTRHIGMEQTLCWYSAIQGPCVVEIPDAPLPQGDKNEQRSRRSYTLAPRGGEGEFCTWTAQMICV